MAYSPTIWVAGAAPGISADRLNKSETGLRDAALIADTALDKVYTKVMPVNTNPNTLTTNGKYDLTSNSVNMPPSTSTRMYIDVTAYHDGTYVSQTAYNFFGNQIWTRRCTGGTWTAWTLVSNETVRMPTNTDFNNLTEDGRTYVIDGATLNTPQAGLNYYVTVYKAPDAPTYLKQVAHHANGNRAWTRTCQGGVWTAWTPLHTSYISPSDNVLLSLPTERSGTGQMKKIQVNRAGRYRLKGEYRSTANGTTVTANLHSADNPVTTQLSANTLTYAAFSADLGYIAENAYIYINVNSASPMFLRNITLCGTEVYDNPNTSIIGDN